MYMWRTLMWRVTNRWISTATKQLRVASGYAKIAAHAHVQANRACFQGPSAFEINENGTATSLLASLGPGEAL